MLFVLYLSHPDLGCFKEIVVPNAIATDSVVLTVDERKRVLAALDLQWKSLERAQRAAVSVEIAQAFSDAAKRVQDLAAKFR